MGIRETLGMGEPVSWTHVGEHLRDHYIRNSKDQSRRAEAVKRDQYYEGGGDEYIKRFIYLAFEDELTRKLRADLVGHAKWNNVIKRVTRELATVYSKPATRKVGDGDELYKEFQEVVGMDSVMRELDRRLVYQDDVWVQYRVQKDTGKPVVDVISPSMFWPVCHPNDRTQMIAVVIDQTPQRVNRATPCFRVWTAEETFMLDSECRVIVATFESNPLGRIPGVLASMRPASTKGQILTDSPAADLVAAHEAIWFQNILLMKESKSANRQAYLSGDTTRATFGQSADTEREVVLPEGVAVTVVDRGMDLTQFRENADHIVERAAANYGLPPSLIHQKESSSGAEAHARRLPLRELREERVPVLRAVERELAQIQSLVNANDLPEYAFKTEGWGIDFGEVQQPMTEAEMDAVFEKRRQLGLTNTISEIMDRNPDLRSPEEAWGVLDTNIQAETLRIAKMKEMLAMSGSMGASTEDVNAGGKKPFEANRGKPGPDDDDNGGAAPAQAAA
jgi:hypothetical protein